MSKDRLLSDEELEEKLFELAVKNVVNERTGKEYYALDPKDIFDLINTQKRLYAESEIKKLPRINHSALYIGNDTYEIYPDKTVVVLNANDADRYIDKLRLRRIN